MSKRKVDEDSDIDVSSTDESDVENTPQDAEEEEIVDVDFDYFDLNPEVDFHATKTFLRQLLGDDATQFDISGLSDLILTENSVGTTIKTEGQEGDPFALLSVIDATTNASKPSVKGLLDYFLEKTQKSTEFNLILRKLLDPKKTTKDNSKQLRVGLVISERMINMPVEVVPPMYKMLLQEMENAENAHEKYEFDYFLVLSKIYRMVDAEVESDEKQPQKKLKSKAEPGADLDYFHYEDIVLEANSRYHAHYEYTRKLQETDSRRVFTEYGIDPLLSLILLDKKGLEKSAVEMEEKFPPF